MARTRQLPVGWLFVIPAMFLLIVFLIYPTLWTIRLSFFGGPGFIPTRFVGLDNYVRLFTTDPYFFNGNNFPPTGTVINNILWLFLFTSLVIALGLLIAVLAEKVRYEALVKSIVFIPYAISATAAGIIWLFMYSPDPRIGLLNAVGTAVVPNWQPLAFTGDMALVTFAIIVAAVWIQTGFTTVVISAALKGISADVIEAARVDGANPLQIFSRIQVPMISSTISVLVVTMIIFVIKVFDLILIMGGAQGGPQGSARVIAFTQYVETFANGKGGYGSAIAVIMMILVLPILIANVRQFRREEGLR
ncbi:MAG: sugar ABC transporter permease [Chloroflexi bacterium]|nr:sugar ABC transporter permease [Chloroflexota bacterium]